MCGFAGFLTHASISSVSGEEALLTRMGERIVHRGPDDGGVWLSPVDGIGVSHRRLSIVDLSPAGHQPMESACGRYVIVFNGEVYNHQLLRAKLNQKCEGINWRGGSDTETLLAGFVVWGVQSTIQQAIGMFAFALWDKKEKSLVLGRDRIGEKPVFYGWQENTFLFGSELKALKEHPSFIGDLNRGSVSLFLRYGYVPAPHSIYRDIYKLEPGSLLTVSLRSPEPLIEKYWDVSSIVSPKQKPVFSGTTDDAVDQLEFLATDAINMQMMADVPLGAFLSGGVDSSSVVALMQKLSNRPVRTFTIGFNEGGYNEAEDARRVAQHLGTDHTELFVTPRECMQVIPKLPVLYDEPFSDSSQIPTYLVSELARESVTVALSGDGGDELFCGYNRYSVTAGLWKKISLLPRPLREVVAYVITKVPPYRWDQLGGLVGAASKVSNLGDKLHKGAGVLSSGSVEDLYVGLVSQCSNPSDWVIGDRELGSALTAPPENISSLLDGVERMMALDLVTYLPDDILAKVDRAAMGASLETRVPFLDHRVVEFAWSLPLDMKLREGQTKWPLRQLLYKYVPKELIERPKMGFGVPLDFWLRGELREWAEELLDENRLRNEGVFYPGPVRRLWEEHLSGKYNRATQLWSILMFQAWLEK